MKKLLLIIFTLFTTLWATSVGDGTTQPTNVLPVLVEGGEPFDNLDHFYIDGLNVNSVAVSRDGRYIVSGFSNRVYDVNGVNPSNIKVWDIEKEILIKNFILKQGSSSNFVTISEDEKYIACRGGNDNIQIWDIEKETLIKNFNTGSD